MDYMQRLKQIRQKRKVSQEKISEVLEIPRTQYTRYETGFNEMPLRYFAKTCQFLNTSADYILGLKDEE